MTTITQETIRSVSSLPIVDVLSRSISIKRYGSVYKACCPLHNEKTPSFVVNPNTNTFKCFGCGKGGDIITFYMQHDNLTFFQAVKYLCEEYKVKFETTGEQQDDTVQKEVDTLYKINRAACDFFKSKMPDSKSYKNAIERGYTDETISQWEIGHTSSLYTQLYKNLSELGFEDSEIEKSTLSKKRKEGTFYDSFRDRMIFPIHNILGRIIGFSARRNLESMTPKYINTAETRVFKKSKELFGLYFAKKSIVELDEAIVVEGATDVISLHQAKATNAVGTLGTSFTPEHASVLKRYTNKIVLLYDGDNAGLKATFKSCEELLKEGLFVYICPLPEGKDPDQLCSELGDGVLKYIAENKKEFIKYRISLLDGSVANKVKLAKELARMINLHPDRLAREVLMHDYNKEFGFKSSSKPSNAVEVEAVEDKSEDLSIYFHVVRVMLYYMNDWNVSRFFDTIPEEYYKKIFPDEHYYPLFEFMMKNRELSMSHVLHNENDTISSLAKEVINTNYEYFENEEYDIMTTLLNFEVNAIKIQQEELLAGDIDSDYKRKYELYEHYRSNCEAELLNLVTKRNGNENRN